jgi:hypothetical protein
MEFAEWLRSGLIRKIHRIKRKPYTPRGCGGGAAGGTDRARSLPMFMMRC